MTVAGSSVRAKQSGCLTGLGDLGILGDGIFALINTDPRTVRPTLSSKIASARKCVAVCQRLAPNIFWCARSCPGTTPRRPTATTTSCGTQSNEPGRSCGLRSPEQAQQVADAVLHAGGAGVALTGVKHDTVIGEGAPRAKRVRVATTTRGDGR